MMNDAEFSALAESLYLAVENALDHLIDEQDAELDYENGNGVITIDCESSRTKVIVSRQQANHQIWVAAKSGGFHCSYQDRVWFCKSTQETLSALLSRVCTEQSQQTINFEGVDNHE